MTEIEKARKVHYDMHSRTIPIEECDIRICKIAVKIAKKERNG